MGSSITFSTPAGDTVDGYLATPGGPSKGNLVVLQEWWGLNDQIRGVADYFATAGYTSLAPDLYRGRVTQAPDEAEHLMTGLDFVGATEQDVRGAAQHLAKYGGKTAVIGFCMGGALVIIAAVKAPEVQVAICYYGIPPPEAADPRELEIPFQGHFASEDDWCTPFAVDQLESALSESGTTFELHRYEGAHGFTNEEHADIYDEAATELAYRRSLEFLAKHI